MKKEDTIIKILESHTKKLDEHDTRFDRIIKILESHTKKLDEHDTRFGRIVKKLDEHDKFFDRIVNKLLQHDDDIASLKKTMATKADKADIRQIMNTLDTLVGLYKKKDQEFTMVTHGTRRLDDRVTLLEKDMTRIKPLVGLGA